MIIMFCIVLENDRRI